MFRLGLALMPHLLNHFQPTLNRRKISVDFSMERLQRFWKKAEEAAASAESQLNAPSTGDFHAGITESSAQIELTTLFR